MLFRSDDYYYLKEIEWEGCLGVAIVISVIEGITPNLFSLSKHLDIPNYDFNLQNAFERLRINGIFNSQKGVTNDPFLKGNGTDRYTRTASECEREAWCHIAGVASGFIGLGKIVDKRK